MATKIPVVGKVITIPKTPYLVQTDMAAEHFQFEITETDIDITDCDFYLLFRTERNSASMQPLPDKTITTGKIILDWVPDEEFTAVNGYTDIQLKAMKSGVLKWNTTKATVYVYNELLNTAAAQVNPKTPTLFLYYLHVMQGLKSEVQEIKDTFMNNPTIAVDPNVGTPSAEITVEGTGSAQHYHFSFHNLKGEPGEGGGDVADVMTSKDGTTYESVVDPVDKKARINLKDIKHVYHQATEPTDAEPGDVWVTDEESGGTGTWGLIDGDIQDQTDLQAEFATKQNKVYHQDTEPVGAVEGDIWVTDEEGGGGNVKDVKVSRNGTTYQSVLDSEGNAKINLKGHSKVYHQNTEPADAIAGDVWLTDEEGGGGYYTGQNGVVVVGDKIKLDPAFIQAIGGEFKVTGEDIVLVDDGITYRLSETAKKANLDAHTNNFNVHINDTERTKLSSVETGAQKNVQSDLNETNSDSDAFIKGRETVVNHVADTFKHLNVTDRTKLDAMLTAFNFNLDFTNGVVTLTL